MQMSPRNLGANFLRGMKMQKLFVRLDELTLMVGLSKSTIYSLIDEGKFPRQKRLARRAVGWSVEEVTQWAREAKERDDH